MEHFNINLSFGLDSEKRILPVINDFFGTEIMRSSDKYAKHDFYDNEGNRYELRTRKFSSNTYPTTIVACDKYYCKSNPSLSYPEIEGNVFFLFRFTDGLFYIPYGESFKNFFVDPKYSRNTGRIGSSGKVKFDKARPHIFIPVRELIKISDI